MKLAFLGNRYETTDYRMLPTEEAGFAATFLGSSYQVRKVTNLLQAPKPRRKNRGVSY